MSSTQFESQKNQRAALYTAMVVSLLFLVFFYSRWEMPSLPQPNMEEGLEVNLGSSDAGLGEDQPLQPDAPAPANNTVQQETPASPPAAEKEILTNDREENAPVIKKETTPKPTPKPTPKDVIAPSPKKIISNPTPKIAPTPEPKAKALFKGTGANGSGGNDADTYKKGGNQGIAGGTGDQGKTGGDPDSKNYSGNGRGSGGINITSGLAGRNITGTPSFQDDFNENAKVAVDIRVDASGTVIAASYQPRGSTTSDAGMKAIALRKARQVKFNRSEDESVGTILFNFRVTQ